MKNEILIKGQTRTMTVKEIASAIGVAESTIRNKIAELFPNRVKKWDCNSSE